MPNVVVVPFDALVSANERLMPARGRLISSEKYRDALGALHLRFKAHRPKIKLIEGDVCLDFHFYWPDKRKRDTSNYTKMIEDALNGVAYYDDQQIADGRKRRSYDRANPRVELSIREAA